MNRPMIWLLIALTVAILVGMVRPARAGDDWEWWLYTPLVHRMAGNVKLDAQGMFRWKNDMKDYYYRGVIAGGSYSLTSWVYLGAHFWYKETRKDERSNWKYYDIYVVNLDFNYQPGSGFSLKEYNRIEYDNALYKWTLRAKPRVEYSLSALGLKPVTFYLDNEFFFKFDLDDERDTFSENRFTAAAAVKIIESFRVTVAYRSVAKQDSATGDWGNTNVLVTSTQLSF